MTGYPSARPAQWLLLALLIPTGLFGQLRGTVLDPTHAPVAGAHVTASPGTGERATVSGANGEFLLELAPGRHRILGLPVPDAMVPWNGAASLESTRGHSRQLGRSPSELHPGRAQPPARPIRTSGAPSRAASADRSSGWCWLSRSAVTRHFFSFEALKKTKLELETIDHPIIRSEEACFQSSFAAVQLAKKHNTRLHILHISTDRELQLFSNMLPLAEKRITAEVCVHHLHFSQNDYDNLGNLIKCNPAIKAPFHRLALWDALLENKLDVIATDHAPHTLAEKEVSYEKAHAGLPLVQHSLLLMLYYVQQGRITLERVVEKMSHAVATCFKIKERGFIREGYHADLVMVDLNKPYEVNKNNILYKCGWSPLDRFRFPASVEKTFVSGNLVYENNTVNDSYKGTRLKFDV